MYFALSIKYRTLIYPLTIYEVYPISGQLSSRVSDSHPTAQFPGTHILNWISGTTDLHSTRTQTFDRSAPCMYANHDTERKTSELNTIHIQDLRSSGRKGAWHLRSEATTPWTVVQDTSSRCRKRDPKCQAPQPRSSCHITAEPAKIAERTKRTFSVYSAFSAVQAILPKSRA